MHTQFTVTAKPVPVKVRLQEFTVKTDPSSVPAGPVDFKVKNKGSVTHEMVVVKTDGAPLPIKADGSVDEDQIPEANQVGEVEDLEPGDSKTLHTDPLEPGSYTLFCNVVQADGTTVSHYAQGMHTQFTVTAKPVPVKVRLQEFTVKTDPSSVPAGPVDFKVKNKGSVTHEMVVVKTDGAPLPIKADGSVDEDQIPEANQVGEVEDLEPGDSKTLHTDPLEPGSYTLFCNVVQADGTTVSHYAEGMHTQFTVTAKPVPR